MSSGISLQVALLRYIQRYLLASGLSIHKHAFIQWLLLASGYSGISMHKHAAFIQRYLLTSNAYILRYLLSGSSLAVFLAISTYKYSLLALQYTLKLTLYIAMCCISLFANLMRKWKLCILHIFFVSPLPIVLNNSQKATKVSLKSSKAIESKSNLGKQIVLRTMAHFECQYTLGSSII